MMMQEMSWWDECNLSPVSSIIEADVKRGPERNCRTRLALGGCILSKLRRIFVSVRILEHVADSFDTCLLAESSQNDLNPIKTECF